MGAPQRHQPVSRGSDGTAGKGGGAPANPPLPVAAPLAVQHRPAGYREPPSTILTRIHASHPDAMVVEVPSGWKATRGDDTVFSATIAGLEAKMDGLW
jgi:hypothetical protein